MRTDNKKSILIDKDLHHDFKVYCVKQGLLMHKVVEKLIENKLDSPF
jgi:hypothetical protein